MIVGDVMNDLALGLLTFSLFSCRLMTGAGGNKGSTGEQMLRGSALREFALLPEMQGCTGSGRAERVVCTACHDAHNHERVVFSERLPESPRASSPLHTRVQET